MTQAKTAAALLGIEAAHAIVSVVGCGGKTSFIERLAFSRRHKRVLISPTAKILPMVQEGVTLCDSLAACQAHRAQIGVQCLGIRDKERNKLTALPLALLSTILDEYELALLEADGSRGLPCKGWLPSEPVIAPETTHTVGIVTLCGLGQPADENYVLRLPEFLTLTGLQEGECITAAALMRMVCAPQGMFQYSRGARILLVNQVENAQSAVHAQIWLQGLLREAPTLLSCAAYGSAKNDAWTEVVS